MPLTVAQVDVLLAEARDKRNELTRDLALTKAQITTLEEARRVAKKGQRLYQHHAAAAGGGPVIPPQAAPPVVQVAAGEQGDFE